MRDANDKTRLSYWFPLIEAAGLPVPKTTIIRLPEGESDCRLFLREPKCLNWLVDQITKAAPATPFFLRTDYTSAKHGWSDTCYVANLNKIRNHIYEIWEFSECADLMGLPTDVWVVREMLNTSPVFRAFRGDMPISREFRFFVRDGAITHIQPYWPPATIKHPSLEGWRDVLDGISKLSPEEERELSDITKRVNVVVPGYWSVDWLWTTDRGWVLTDMAEGNNSFTSGIQTIQQSK